MTTAEFIKKREEGKINPVVNQPVFEPASTTMTDNDVITQSGPTVQQPKENKVSLYDVGKSIQGSTINQLEQMKSGNYSPITTPEYEKFRNEVIGAQQFGVETEEQRKKRERADFIKQGLTGFTEGLSALANLYYTTKGAPSQKHVSQMPALQQQLYRERLERDKKLENFRAWMRDKARRDEERAYQEQQTADARAYQDAIRKEQNDENRRRWEYNTKKQEEATAKADARYEAEQRYKREQDALTNKHRSAQLAETQRYHNAMIANRANNGNGSGTSVMHRKNGTSILNTKNGFMNVDWKKVDSKAERQLYDIISEEIRNKYPLKDELGDYDEKYAKSQMNAAIAEAAVTDEKIAKWLVDSNAGTYQQQEANPIHSNGQQGSGQGSKGQQQNGNSGNKWDAYDVTGGGTDFSKQKRPRQQGTATKDTSSQMSNVTPSSNSGTQQTQVDSESEKPKLKGMGRYKAMVEDDKKQAEAERKAKEERIKKASAKRASTVQEAKELRAELNSILNEDLPEFDVEKFINDNNIGFLDAMKYRMHYADDEKERAKIKRKIQRLNDIIGNG